MTKGYPPLGRPMQVQTFLVCHWSTIPPILKALGDPREVTIERSEYDNLFLVIPQEDRAPTVLHLHY